MNQGSIKIGVWNVGGLYVKEKLLQEELKKANAGKAVIPETKNKLKNSQELGDYILLYSGVPTNKRAAAGIAIMIKAKFNPLTPNAPLTSKRCGLYIYSTNIYTEYFKHGIYSRFFFSLFKMQFVS